jgi:hypothetical protein
MPRRHLFDRISLAARVIAIALDLFLFVLGFWFLHRERWFLGGAALAVGMILGLWGSDWAGWRRFFDPLLYRRDDHFDA